MRSASCGSRTCAYSSSTNASRVSWGTASPPDLVHRCVDAAFTGALQVEDNRVLPCLIVQQVPLFPRTLRARDARPVDGRRLVDEDVIRP
jgi:hypothetical protein